MRVERGDIKLIDQMVQRVHERSRHQ